MGFFPSTARRRVVAAVAAGSALLSLAAIPLASADDLKDRRSRVEGDIRDTRQQLDQSSAGLVAATQAVDAAQARLATAEKYLATTQGELAAAEALDKQTQAQLDAAVLALERARSDLSDGRVKLREQEDLLGQIAVQTYQTGDPSLLGLSMVLTSRDPAELTSQLNSVQNLLDRESVTLARLEASRVILAVQKESLAAAKAEVAKQRKAAAENLDRKEDLQAQAKQAEVRISGLVAASTRAREVAERAKAADLKQLRELDQERDRISAMLRARAERARRRAAAAAAAAQDRVARIAPATSRALTYPVDGYVTSPYGMRFHPVYKRWSLHDGMDIGASCGTPIRAAASGTVIAAYYNGAYGNRIIMDHGYQRGVGLGTSYNHMSGYSTYVGQRVQRGDIIGYVGTTGASTGCHLHFMVFENGATVNPMNWL